MKNLVYFFAAGTLVLAACSNDPAYKISGTIENVADGEYVYLQEAQGRQLVKLDSAVVTAGAFTFEGRQDVAVIRYLTYTPKEGRGPRMDFFLENGNINIHIGKNEDQYAKGTPNNDIYQTYRTESGALNKEMGELYKKSREEGLTEEQNAALEKKFNELDAKIKDLTFKTIDANIANPVGIYLFPNFAYTFDLEQQKALIAKVPAELKNESINNIAKRIEVLEKTAVGQKFTDFTLPSPEGNPVKLGDIIAKNKYTLIDFWASWCGPCRREMPNVVAAYKEYNKKGFGIVGVSLDNDAEAWKKAIKDMGMTWDHMSDVKGWQCEGAALYGVNSIPATVLVAQDGTIIERNLRGDAIKEKLAELLK